MTDHRKPLPSAIVVMGVSGSGKTTIASMLARRLGFEFEDGDWFHPPANVEKMHSGIPLTDEDRWPWLNAIAAFIDEVRASGRHAVIACSALRRVYRDILIGSRGDAVRLVFLKGDKDLIARRMSTRQGHFMPPELLNSQFATLEEPGPAEHPIAVSIVERPGRVVKRIISALNIPLASLPIKDSSRADPL